MNPEDNNPLTNSGAPNLGAPANPGDMSGMTSPLAPNPIDSMTGSPASDATGMNQNMGIENTIEEPLVPAAPVPGSIGSVTSVPPVNPAAPAPFAPADSTGAVPVADSAAQPQAPFNPFAGPAAPAGADSPAPAPAVDLNGAPTAPTTPPPVQPTSAPKAAPHGLSKSPLTIVLAVVAALGVILAIIFGALFFKEKNSPKVVYVPSVADDTTNAAIEVLSCSRENDFTYLIGYDHSVIGMQNVTLSYTGDKLSSIALDASATFDSESDANVAKDNYANAAVIRESMTADYQVEGSTMKANFNIAEGSTLSDADAAAIIYGDGTEGADLSLSAVQTHYESIGYTCALE